MPNKLQTYVQMAGQTAANLTRNLETWTGFLTTASRLYKYPFPNQLLIYAQNPQSTAVACFDTWTKKMRRYVRRGAKGIALIDIRNGKPSLRYVFDVLDTGKKKDSCNLYLWQYKEDYRDAITTALEKHYNIPCNNGFPEQLEEIAVKLATDYWQDYSHEIMYEIGGSMLEGMDELNVGTEFKAIVSTSTAYALLSRCGLHPEKHFRVEDFQYLCDFNTQRLIQILGTAVSQSSSQVLRQIAIAIFDYERDKAQGSQKSTTSHSKTGNTQAEKPTIPEIYSHFTPVIKEIVLADEAYQNACRNSDPENAELEFKKTLKRAALTIKDLKFMKIYYDLSEHHNKMQNELFAETYPMLSSIPEQHTKPAIPEAINENDTPADKPKATTPEPNPEDNTPDIAEPEPTETENGSSEPIADTSCTTLVPTTQIPEPALDTNEQPLPNQEIILDASAVRELPTPATTNFCITDDQLGAGGPKEKFHKNMTAIATLKKIEVENRTATPDEQQVLSQYVGWGGIPDAFDNTKPDWQKEYQELKTALTPEEYASARASTLNAHYTSPAVIKAIYTVIGNLGFKSGNILEPSCGIGNFFGLIPESMKSSKLYGVELDSISGRIAKLLYPKAKISVCGYEKTDYPNNFFDVAIGNVPFGNYKVNDADYNKENLLIHDYFFCKTADKVRAGGIIAFITSNGISGGTLDKKDNHARRCIARQCNLLGAVRLPNGVFSSNAGTDIATDIVFLQKREIPLASNEPFPEWTETEMLQKTTHTNKNGEIRHNHVTINRYFQSHPEMVLGNLEITSGPFGAQLQCKPVPDADLAAQLHAAVSHIHGVYSETVPAVLEETTLEDVLPADPNVKNYSFTLVNGKVYYRENSTMIKPELNVTAKNRVKSLIGLRDCVHTLINLQMDEFTSDSAIEKQQAELNRLYSIFTQKYGLINDRANRLAFDKDSSYYLLCSLEILDDNGKLLRKADMFTKRTIKQHKTITSVDTASEALTVSIGERAKVDLAYMAQLIGKDESELIKELRGVIYRDPIKNTWQTADEYLSGNVRRKLRQARKAAEQDNAYQVNVDALEKAQPKDLDASEIEVRLGATWIDKSYIQQFMVETLNTPTYLRNSIIVNYSPITTEWFISNKNSIPHNNVAAYTTYGTSRANAYRILEDSLNLRDVRIYDTVEDAEGKEKRVLNAKETTLASQKQQALRDAFQDWIFREPERRQTLVKLYNELMNSTHPREYDGSHIVFSGINPAIQLQPHQLNAIARVLYGGNTLLAHEVGAGKSFEMIASAMESKRLGLCHKAICVVPNHLTEQMAAEWLRLYPAANILVTTKKDFETANRKKFCARIATSDIDAVIIGHSQFERIPISAERQERLIQSQIDEITEGIGEVKASGGERFTIKQLERTRKNLEDRLEKLQANHRKDNVVTFEELGVDMMLVDESDNYKNLFLYTKMRNVAGLSTTDAQKSSDMFAKCQYLDEITGGKGIVFATGTPISNSMTEMYTIMRYLQYDRLQELGMGHFDCWASRFGETTTALELAPEGTGYRARTRFAKFFNLPELMQMFREVADIKTADQLNLPTPEVEYHNIVTEPTQHQQEMVKELSKRAEKIHNGSVDSHIDNMLKITSDGRKLGLDQRIINPLLPDDASSKVNACIDNVYRIWEDYSDTKAAQLIFCDISTPKNDGSFNIYDDIRQKLVQRGVPAEQVRFIHEANSDVQKKELFAKVRSGQVRVLIGSTQKMGAGTNVQDKLIALHDLDAPYRPRDLKQRSGRIERRGCQNAKVYIFRYVTNGTFDAYLWQMLENKQKFISQIMTSKSPVRSCEDVDESVLSFAEVKALCAGDPRIKERMDLELEVSKLKIMKADHNSRQYRLEDDLLKHFPEEIQETKSFITGIQYDIQTLKQHPLLADGFCMKIQGTTYTDKTEAGTALLDACQDISSTEPINIGSYRGFTMCVKFGGFTYKLSLKGAIAYKVDLGEDARGNITRIDNTLNKVPESLANYKTKLANLLQQQEAAKTEAGKPFEHEEELRIKSARLAELDAELNIGAPQPQTAA